MNSKELTARVLLVAFLASPAGCSGGSDAASQRANAAACVTDGDDGLDDVDISYDDDTDVLEDTSDVGTTVGEAGTSVTPSPFGALIRAGENPCLDGISLDDIHVLDVKTVKGDAKLKADLEQCQEDYEKKLKDGGLDAVVAGTGTALITYIINAVKKGKVRPTPDAWAEIAIVGGGTLGLELARKALDALNFKKDCQEKAMKAYEARKAGRALCAQTATATAAAN